MNKKDSSLYNISLETENYKACYASTLEEKQELYNLRHEIFNLEIGSKNLKNLTLLEDRDEYDDLFDHLIVIHKPTNAVIGTYRMQTNEMATKNKGFYSESEFDLSKMPKDVIDNSIEVGRACIEKSHRNKNVLFLMWRGIAKYHIFHKKRYLFGCSSTPFDDKYIPYQMMEYFIDKSFLHPNIFTPVKPKYFITIEEPSEKLELPVKIPDLLRIYLKYSSKICSRPALDSYFNTIDFLTLMDTKRLSKKQYDFLIA